MPDKDAGTPRVYLARHGETEWTKNGRYTGITELELTENGVRQVLGSSKMLIGPGKLIDPGRLAHVFISPRKRAQQSFDFLFDGAGKKSLLERRSVTTTEALAEWDYGAYEGLLTKEIRARRESQGLDKEKPWDIWRDGCEDGETPHQVTARLDALIQEIQEIQQPYMHGEKPVDIVLVVSPLLPPLVFPSPKQTLISLPGCARPSPPRLRKAVVKVPHGNAAIHDDGTRCYRDSQARPPILPVEHLITIKLLIRE